MLPTEINRLNESFFTLELYGLMFIKLKGQVIALNLDHTFPSVLLNLKIWHLSENDLLDQHEHSLL